MKVNNHHDKIFKKLMASSANAIDFLKFVLPQKVASVIDFDTLHTTDTSHLTEDLDEIFSDVVLECRLKDIDADILISILVEHKSYIDHRTPFQVAEYVISAYKKQMDRLDKGEKLKLVVPIIYYHAEKEWKYININGYFDHIPLPLNQFIPKIDNHFVDIKSKSDEEIDLIENMLVSATLLSQKYIFNERQLINKLISIITKFEGESDRNQNNYLFVYIFEYIKKNKFEVMEMLKEAPKKEAEKVLSLYQQLLFEGREEERKIQRASTIKSIVSMYKAGIEINQIATFIDWSVDDVRAVIDEKDKK